jgi:hypothetical protein
MVRVNYTDTKLQFMLGNRSESFLMCACLVVVGSHVRLAMFSIFNSKSVTKHFEVRGECLTSAQPNGYCH